MGIKVTNFKLKKTRIVKVNLILQNEETGDLYEEETPVEYYSDTIAAYRERFEGKNKEETKTEEALTLRVKCFPEIIDEDGKPLQASEEVFANMHPSNVGRILTAIQHDMNPNGDDNPKKSPSVSSQQT